MVDCAPQEPKTRVPASADSLLCDEDWSTVYQIVVPLECRSHVIELAPEDLWSGYLRVTKTYNCILEHFFWPGMKAEVARYCKAPHTCQIVRKLNQVVPPAPLHPIPAFGEPFEHLIVDCVGRLPRKQAGN